MQEKAPGRCAPGRESQVESIVFRAKTGRQTQERLAPFHPTVPIVPEKTANGAIPGEAWGGSLIRRA
jgi:hypothetical protein